MKKVLALLIFAGLCTAVFLSSPVRSQKKEKLRKNAHKIENNYIVVLDDSVVGERGRARGDGIERGVDVRIGELREFSLE